MEELSAYKAPNTRLTFYLVNIIQLHH